MLSDVVKKTHNSVGYVCVMKVLLAYVTSSTSKHQMTGRLALTHTNEPTWSMLTETPFHLLVSFSLPSQANNQTRHGHTSQQRRRLKLTRRHHNKIFLLRLFTHSVTRTLAVCSV
jgi:hypothetical protein